VQTIVVGVDGSDAADAALDVAVDEAAAHGARLRVVVVWQMPVVAYTDGGGVILDEESLDRFRETAERVAGNALARVRRRVPALDCTTEVRGGQPAEELLGVGADADLIVVGSRGLGGFKRLMMGSVSDQVVRHATCPVLVVRGGPERGAASAA